MQWSGVEQALLLNAGRYSHTQELIIPHLAKGVNVICDRYVDSTYAYQAALGASLEMLQELHKLLLNSFYPDLTLWLDVSPEVAWSRVEKRQEQGVVHAFEVKQTFQKKVYEQYVLLAKRFPDRIIRIDAHKTVEEVFASITHHVSRVLGI